MNVVYYHNRTARSTQARKYIGHCRLFAFTYEKYRYDLILPWVACQAYLALFARHLCVTQCDMQNPNRARNHPTEGFNKTILEVYGSV